jgi:uncharacterized membrane protein HdeD (DUF308 family)
MAEATADSWVGVAKKNSGWLIALGVIQIIVGILAIMAPLVTGIATTLLVGGFLVVAGFMRVIGAFKAGSFGRGLLAFLAGVLAVVAGFLMLARPGLGLATLTLMLAAFLFATGISEIILAFHVRPEKGWGWMVFDGVIAILLGLLIGWQWPVSGMWAVGTLVGIHILINGWTGIMVGIGARSAAKEVAAAT